MHKTKQTATCTRHVCWRARYKHLLRTVNYGTINQLCLVRPINLRKKADKSVVREGQVRYDLFWNYRRTRKSRRVCAKIFLDDEGKEVIDETDLVAQMTLFWKRTKEEYSRDQVNFREINFDETIMQKTNDIAFNGLKRWCTAPFTVGFVKRKAMELKNKKIMGNDLIPNAFIKIGTDVFFSVITGLFNKMFKNEILVSKKWKSAYGTMLNKEGVVCKLSGYRTIMVNCAMAKLYSKLIHHRLIVFFEKGKLLGENQQGSRRKRSTADNIFILQQMREKQSLCKQPLFITFLDFSKAFDRVDRSLLYKILEKFGVPELVISAIRKLYEGRTVKLKLGNVITGELDYSAGVIQGDSLSPLLYIIFITVISQQLNAAGNSMMCNHAGFVDDFVCIADSIVSAQLGMDVVDRATRQIGVICNFDKCKVMVENVDHHDKLYLRGFELESVEQYKYLGITFRKGICFLRLMGKGCVRNCQKRCGQ